MITVTVMPQTIYVLVPDKTRKLLRGIHGIFVIYHYTVRHNVIDFDICIYHNYFIANAQMHIQINYTCGYNAIFNEPRGIICPYIPNENICSHLSYTNTYTEMYICTSPHLHHKHNLIYKSHSDCDVP